MAIRSDNEPAIVQVVKAAVGQIRLGGVDVADEGSVPYDPQTNGDAEAAVRVLKDSLCTLQLSLERQVRARIPVGHPVMTWLARHVAFMRTLKVRGEDGKTAYQRIKGRDTSGPRLIGFGEHCRFTKRANEKGEAGSSFVWTVGVFMGLDYKTGQYI